jgi:hypothetical protein
MYVRKISPWVAKVACLNCISYPCLIHSVPCVLTQGCTNFPKNLGAVSSLGARRVTWNNFHPESPQMLGAIVQNLVATVLSRPGFVQPCLFYTSSCVQRAVLKDYKGQRAVLMTDFFLVTYVYCRVWFFFFFCHLKILLWWRKHLVWKSVKSWEENVFYFALSGHERKTERRICSPYTPI